MIVLDASVVIAFLNSRDPHHARATQLFEEHSTAGFQIHSLTIAEVLVGAVRTGRGTQLLDDLTSIGVKVHQLTINEPLILAELRATTGLKMPDCCVLAVAQHQALPLATFDDRLAHAAQTLGVEVLR